MEDKIVPQITFQKEKEELLPNGTLVVIKNDESNAQRKILWSIPHDFYPHRYCVENWSFICELRDFVSE